MFGKRRRDDATGVNAVRQVRPGVYEVRVVSMKHNGKPVADIHDLIPKARDLEEHLKTCTTLGGHPHSIKLQVRHQPFPGNARGQSYVHLGEIQGSTWEAFVLTRNVNPNAPLVLNPQLGDKWGRLVVVNGELLLFVNTNPVPYYD